MSRTSRALAAVSLGAAASLAVTAAPAGAAARFTPGAPGAGDPYFPDMGNGGYDVAHYDIGLTYDPGTKGIQAVAKIKARATQNLSRFDLDFLGPLKISSLRVDGRAASYTRTGAQELVVTPRKGLRKHRTFTVTVAYSGVPQTINDATLGTSGWVPTPDGAVMLNQPFGAATVFPVNDHPTDKATYTFTLSAPRNLTTLSNGDLRGRWTKGGWTTTRWEVRNPMASELSMLAIGKYDVLTGRTKAGIPNLTATDLAMAIKPDDAKKFHQQTAEVTDFQNGLYGRYPFTSTGGIVVKGASATRWRRRAAPCTISGAARRHPERGPPRPRAGSPVVRRLGLPGPVVGHLAERGLRDVLRMALGRAQQRHARPAVLRRRVRDPGGQRPVEGQGRRPGPRPHLRRARLRPRRDGRPRPAPEDR